LASTFAIPAISTGDIFRANVKNQTELGLQVKAIMAAGKYVPDSVTNAVVEHRLAEDDAKAGFLLDGYPRTPDQVHELDRMLTAQGTALDVVVLITADTDEVVGRLSNRAIVEGRVDDTEAVIRHRLELYEEQTAPLIDLYAARDLVVVVDGLGAVEDVTSRIVTALAAKGISASAV
jgi:adenylate kinase